MRKHLAEFRECQPQEDSVEVEDEFLSTRQLLKKHSTARKFDLTSSVKDTATSRRLNWDYQIKSLTTSLDELEACIKDLAKQSLPDLRDFQLLRNGFWPHCENAERLKSQILKMKVESEGGEHEMGAQEIKRYLYCQKDITARIYRIYGTLDDEQDLAKRSGRFWPRRG